VSIVWRCASITQQTVATARRGASIIPQQPTSVHPSDTLLARTPSSTPFFSYSVTLDFLFFLRGKNKTTTDISSAENKIEPGLINAADSIHSNIRMDAAAMFQLNVISFDFSKRDENQASVRRSLALGHELNKSQSLLFNRWRRALPQAAKQTRDEPP
jgi:hypothetical protein